MNREVWTYLITRDSVNGYLSKYCSLWTVVRPAREHTDAAVTWGPKSGQYYLGDHHVDDISRWFKTTPDTDRECIIAEQWAEEQKPKTKKSARKEVR